MADNFAITPGTGANAACDEATYSGDTAKVQIMRLVHVTGSEGSKTIEELVRAEDSAHTSGQNGIPALGVRQDTAASLAGTDGDYTLPIFDASGRQHINVGTSALPTGASTSAKQDTGNTSLSSIDGKITAVNTGAVTISAALPAGTNAIGKLAANSGVDIGDVDVTSVSGNVTVVQATGTSLHAVIDTGSTTAVTQATGTNLHTVVDSGTVTTVSTVSTITNVVHVDDNSGSLTVDNGGTFAVQATAVGTIADDATTPGNPVMIGGKAVETDGTDPTAVSAEDDVTIVRTDRNRRLLVNLAHPRLWDANDNQSTAQTNTALKAAPGAGLSLYITDIVISNGATAGNIKFVEDSAGTPVTKIPPLYFGINGGACKTFQNPIRISANKNLGYTSTSVTTHSVMVSGYIAP